MDDIKDVAPKKRVFRQDRICISPEAGKKVEGWIAQANAKKQSLNISPKAIVNWFIEAAPEELSNAQLKDLADRFYDEVKFLQSALLKIRQAKGRGERISLQELLNDQSGKAKVENASGELKTKKAKTNQATLNHSKPEVLDVASLEPKNS